MTSSIKGSNEPGNLKVVVASGLHALVTSIIDNRCHFCKKVGCTGREVKLDSETLKKL